MRKLVLLPVMLLFGCLCLAFTTSNTKVKNSNDEGYGYLPAKCDEPVHFQIDRQEPCPVFKVNPDTGALSLNRDGSLTGMCGNFDGNEDNDRISVSISYSVTNSDGATLGNFIIIDLEEEE